MRKVVCAAGILASTRRARDEASIDAFKARLQRTMWAGAGPLRTAEKLERTLRDIRDIGADSSDVALAPQAEFALNLQEKVELRIMLAVAEAIVMAAIARRESRGAHIRLDFPEQDDIALSRLLTRTGAGWSLA